MKRETTLIAKFSASVSIAILVLTLSACVPSGDEAPAQDCMSVPESCQAPNLCVEDATGVTCAFALQRMPRCPPRMLVSRMQR